MFMSMCSICTIYYYYYYCLSDKLGSNHRYAGIEPLLELINDHERAFAYVAEESSMTFLEEIVKRYRDLDVIEESLGNY